MKYKELECNELTLDILTDFCMEIAKTPLDKERKFVIDTGKQGYIQYKKGIMELIGISKEDIDTKVKELEKELPEGIYHLGR